MIGSHSPAAEQARPDMQAQFPRPAEVEFPETMLPQNVPAGPGAWQVRGFPLQISGVTQPAGPSAEHASPSLPRDTQVFELALQ